MFNCRARKRANKLTQSALKQSNRIIGFITQDALFYIQPKSFNGIELG
ncbi:hypothetical protein GO684_04280 [Wolbachia endosymbiont of Litomosoides brasiliensis]|nr:hypothetical protein [Wolbachia endosymbiont of Litomosoides brasiliensis]NUY39830.1 hypothetical protein [Wolbachia endosymbiont of Litomosoides brasiliensis]